MKIEINIDDKLFNLCEKYNIETALIFDKICYLQLIKGGYELNADLCLINLLEVMIADKLIVIMGDEYRIASKGLDLLKELNVTTSTILKNNDNEFIITESFIEEYLSLFKDHRGVYIKSINKGIPRSLGAGQKEVGDSFEKFYIRFGNDLFEKLNIVKRKGKIPEDFSLKDLILKCTKEYMKDQSLSNYAFTNKASYFIIKYNLDKSIRSTLMSLCEQYLENPPIDEIQLDMFDTTL